MTRRGSAVLDGVNLNQIKDKKNKNKNKKTTKNSHNTLDFYHTSIRDNDTKFGVGCSTSPR